MKESSATIMRMMMEEIFSSCKLNNTGNTTQHNNSGSGSRSRSCGGDGNNSSRTADSCALIFYPQFFTHSDPLFPMYKPQRAWQLLQKVNNIYEVLKLVEGSAY